MFQFKIKTWLGSSYYYCYGDDRFEEWLNIKNIKYKKWTEGKNLFEELEKQIENQAEIIRKQSDKIIPENFDLHNRIDKAIEYIEEKYYDDLFDDTLTQFQDKLLSILRDEDNE